VTLVRHSFQELAADAAAVRLDLDDSRMSRAVDLLVTDFVSAVARADAIEEAEAEGELRRYLREWDHRARQAREQNATHKYERRAHGDNALLKRFGESGEGWVVADSMRSVEPSVAVEVQEPLQEVDRGKHQA
jgi:hypothetical protein